MDEHRKNVLLVNDLPCYGKVALNAVGPVLSAMGFELYRLPTAIFSNTLNYDFAEAADMTEYMRRALAAWQTRGVSFSGVCTGYLHTPQQAELILSLLQRQTPAFVMVDPVMADGGAFYRGLGESTAQAMRTLAAHASVITPNATEAALLTRRAGLLQGPLSDESVRMLLDGLLALGAKAAVMTGCFLAQEGVHYVYGRSAQGPVFRIAYRQSSVRRFGTGDTFSAVLAGCLMCGQSLEKSAAAAARFLDSLFEAAQGMPPCEDGFLLESALSHLPHFHG